LIGSYISAGYSSIDFTFYFLFLIVLNLFLILQCPRHFL
jgi:hypothetical protein